MNERQLAAFVTLRDPDDYPAGTCVAWMDSANRVCGKHADGYLCRKHRTVAELRVEKERERLRAKKARGADHDAKHARAQRLLDELGRVEARLTRLDPTWNQAPQRLDHGVLNTPLRRRIPTETRIAEMAALHARRNTIRRDLGLTGPP